MNSKIYCCLWLLLNPNIYTDTPNIYIYLPLLMINKVVDHRKCVNSRITSNFLSYLLSIYRNDFRISKIVLEPMIYLSATFYQYLGNEINVIFLFLYLWEKVPFRSTSFATAIPRPLVRIICFLFTLFYVF